MDTHEMTQIPFNKYSLLEKARIMEHPFEFGQAVLLDYCDGLNDI